MNSRIPPQNIAAEQALLGGLMLEQEVWDEISLLIKEDDFYKPAHRQIFAAICDLNKRNQAADLVTVTNWLMEKKTLPQVGDASYLAEIMDGTPSTANVANYAQIVREKSLLRRVIQTIDRFADRAYKTEFTDVEAFTNELEASVFKLAEEQDTGRMVEAGDIVKSSLKKIETLYTDQAAVTGVGSGYEDLDRLTSGFQPGELTILAARPSMGKTALSLNLATHAALNMKKTVAYFSVEMVKEQLMMRILGSQARVNLSNLSVGHLNDGDWAKLIEAAAKVSDTSLYIDETSGISPFEILSKARRLKAGKKGLDLICVDYLQLMDLKYKVESREREVSEISKTLKVVAKELQVPVVALAQLNRGVEGRADRRPLLSDLRESGSIEQDADVIMMLFREEYYDRDNPDLKGLAEVIVSKNRNGPTGAVKLRWCPEYGRFENLIDAPAPDLGLHNVPDPSMQGPPGPSDPGPSGAGPGPSVQGPASSDEPPAPKAHTRPPRNYAPGAS